jgi:hypothetical protein
MLYQNVGSVRKALEDNRDLGTSTFTELLASYAKASAADAEENAKALYDRAVHPDSHPVHAVDALEVILPKLMG